MVCGHRIQGASHKKKNTVCQDYFDYQTSGEVTVAAVADGIGSNKHSDFGSKTASTAAVSYCSENISPDMEDDDILTVIYQSFDRAWKAVDEGARIENYSVRECNTTLSLAVFIKGTVYYGQAGDSGIFAFLEDGTISPLTVPQNTDEKNVTYPLQAGAGKWEFAKASQKAASLLLCTDGIWGMFFPKHLMHKKEKHYVSLLAWYIDPEAIKAHSKDQDYSEWLKSEMQELNDNSPENVGYDDITMVVLHDAAVIYSRQPEEYYSKTPTKEDIEKANQIEYERLYGHLKKPNNIDSDHFEHMDKPPRHDTEEAVSSLQKSLQDACEYDSDYWLSMEERAKIARQVFMLLAQKGSKDNIGKKRIDNPFPKDFIIQRDNKNGKLCVIPGNELSDDFEAYYRIIEMVCRLLTNGLSAVLAKNRESIVFKAIRNGYGYGFPDTLLSDNVSRLFLISCQRNQDMDFDGLPAPGEFLSAIEEYIKLIKQGKPERCGNNAHYTWLGDDNRCPWCSIDKNERKARNFDE